MPINSYIIINNMTYKSTHYIQKQQLCCNEKKKKKGNIFYHENEGRERVDCSVQFGELVFYRDGDCLSLNRRFIWVTRRTGIGSKYKFPVQLLATTTYETKFRSEFHKIQMGLML